MIQWDVFDEDGNFLGNIYGSNEKHALSEARLFGMTQAFRAEPI